MDEIKGLVFSWQFLSIGVIVAFTMSFLMRAGTLLWETKIRWIRQVVIFLDGIAPWLPPAIGIGFGALPFWPRPELFQDLSESQSYLGMIFLGLLAGLFYERIWKGVKQVIEARGIDIDLNLPPKKQKEWNRHGS
jgi:hypothetical protein